MSFLFTLLLIFLSVVIVGGIAIFVMNIVSMIIFTLSGKHRTITPRFIIGLTIMSLLYSYIFLSFTSTVILVSYGTKTDVILLKTIIWVFAAIASITTPWIAYNQAKAKLNDENVGRQEAMHVNGLAMNAFVSTVGFIVLAIFPSLISYAWPWVETIINRLL